MSRLSLLATSSCWSCSLERVPPAENRTLARLLNRCRLLPVRPLFDYEAAARIYQRCRHSGITPRTLSTAWLRRWQREHKIPLLHADADFDRMAPVIGCSWPEQPSPANTLLVAMQRPVTSTIPDAPGAYLWRDRDGRVLYVGKANSLRKRITPISPATSR